ncbi:AMP-binding protein [Phenylobacterium sp. Root700]|uniref:AMP-binding protein n=1 Tax=Phenylobacterium sp. Root700 TaxID=1736591 RepID=UPI0006FC7B0D|nr:AMP-binding protein [Phenylobacterium sp. Root700]KRB42680.1 hypothetical protein ASE02_21125 [Phenylobacterium sp. Root700]
MCPSDSIVVPAGPAATFATRLEEFGDAIAVISEGGEQITYAELAARADAFAASLGPGRRLLLIEAANEIPPLIAYVGALRHGHPVLLAAGDSGAQLKQIIDTYRPDARFHKSQDAWALDILPRRTRILHADLAVLLSTSGSTGAAKLVRLSQEAVDANARSIAEYLGLRAEDRPITTLPLHYSYGLSVITSHLQVGATLLLTSRSVIDDAFWAFFEDQNATSISGVPYTYELLERIGMRGKRLPSLRSMTQAGGRLPPQTAKTYGEWARQVGVNFFVMYGQTEATARMAYMPPSMLLDHSGCIGIAIPGGAFRLVGEDGQPITATETPGELVYSGPNVMMGYALEEADLAKGRELLELRTGDLAVRNADGLYRIVGRKSRFSKLFGLRISLDEVEATMERRGLRAVVAGDDSLVAVAVTDGDPVEIAETLSRQFDLPASVIGVVAYSEFPTLSSGKFDYQAILRAAKAQSAGLETAHPPGAGTIQDAFRRTFPRAAISPSDSFISLGGDSLSYVRLSLEVEEQLGLLPPRWEEQSIAELEMLAGRSSGHSRSLFSLRNIEAEVAIRAAAIMAVVINHASTLVVGGGAHVLLMLSGYNFSRYQRTRLVEGDGMSVLVSFLRRIIIPYYAILLVYFAVKREFDVPSLLLISNLFGRSGSFLEPYWFLEALLQSIIILVGLFALPPVRRTAARDPWAFGLALLAGSVVVRMAAHTGFHHDRLLERTPDAIFYMLAFGWCLHQATTTHRKVVLSALASIIIFLQMVDPGALWGRFPYPSNLSHSLWFAVAAGLILWVPRLLLPNILHQAVGIIAAASFYIYLTHGVPVHVLVWMLDIKSLAVTLPVSIAIGLGAYWLSQRAASAAMTGLT